MNTPPEPASLPQKKHGNTGFRRILNAALYSYDGFWTAVRAEAAFRQLLVLHTALIIAVFMLDFSNIERALLIGVSFISLIVELFNSAIEAVVDRISLERHPLSKNAKDMGSAAQTFALILVAAAWLLMLL